MNGLTCGQVRFIYSRERQRQRSNNTRNHREQDLDWESFAISRCAVLSRFCFVHAVDDAVLEDPLHNSVCLDVRKFRRSQAQSDLSSTIASSMQVRTRGRLANNSVLTVYSSFHPTCVARSRYLGSLY